MQVVGRVESVWRYPVKSMHGEELPEGFVGFSGLYGDRLYAFRSSAAPPGFPYLTGREQGMMLRCRVAFRYPERMLVPPNLAEASSIGSGATPLSANPNDGMLDVGMPNGELLPIDDDRLLERLRIGQRQGVELSLLRSDRPLTDCRPISLLSTTTVRQLGEEIGAALDKRRFRANVYFDPHPPAGFAENEWVGRRLRVGATTELMVLQRDSRCKMITLDPDTAEANPEIMRRVKKDHDGTVGVYAAVIVEGVVRGGDTIALLD